MQKKEDKKLILARETIVPLQPEQLENVVGGFIKVTVGKSCCLVLSCNKAADA